MAFKELYKYCQTLNPKVSTKDIKRKAIEITGAKNVREIVQGLDVTKIRGYFLSHDNRDSSIVKIYGCNVIVLARDMNDCWKRFVLTKELMHLFDKADVQTNTEVVFKDLLSEFEAPSPANQSLQFKSEIAGFWMAIACLCPEESRLDFIDQFGKGHIDHYGIALKLKIPEQYVRQLFRRDYKDIIDVLLS